MITLARRAATWWRDNCLISHFSSKLKLTDDELFTKALFCLDISSWQLLIFENELTLLISQLLEKNGTVELNCNYFPCLELERCSNIANIEPSCFKWFHYMKIVDNVIYVATDPEKNFTVLE